MADFALWVVACGDGFLWPEGEFLKAYTGNRREAVDRVVEDSAVGTAVRTFMKDRPEWHGTTKNLLAVLAGVVGEVETKSRDWPRSAKGLSNDLSRLAPALRAQGVEYSPPRKMGHDSPRVLSLKANQRPQGHQRFKGAS
jgi:hypothetical protein